MVEATKEFFTKYATFSGRTSRKNYWLAVLGLFLIAFVIGIIAGIIGYALDNKNISNIFMAIFELAILIPGIAMSVRRLHDINKSGWWYFISFVPFVGSIILFVFTVLPSVEEGNNY